MKKMYMRSRSFFKNFIIISCILLTVTVWIIFSVYSMSVRTLEQEVKNLNMNLVYEYEKRIEEVLKQCNTLSSNLCVDPSIQIFFTNAKPEALFNNYYDEIAGKMKAYGLSYVDSVILYAPKYESVFSSDFSHSKTVSEMRESKELEDLSWMELIRETERTTTEFHIRSRADRWPYYLSVIKHYRSGSVDGVVIINIDLKKLFEYLTSDKNTTIKLYGIDHLGRVFLKEQKRELYVPVSELSDLKFYKPQETFNVINSEEGYAYAQVYSEKYKFTFATIMQVSDFLMNIEVERKHFLHIALGAAILVIAVACIYSRRLVRPIQSIKRLLRDPVMWNQERKRYDEDIQEIADQIISHLQSNTQLRDELDKRLDLLNRTQMQALQAQINPHFLFNTLNMISVMVESDCGDGYLGVELISALSDILRYSLEESKNVSIREEVEYAQKYLSILKYRYQGFEVVIDVKEGMYDYMIPRLVLQPLLENALQHGIAPCLPVRKGELRLCVTEVAYTYSIGKEAVSVCIDIEDNGIGMDEQKLRELRECINDHSDISTEHIGVSNVAQRFYLYFHNEQEFILESALGKGTHIRIVFPEIVNEESQEVASEAMAE